MKRHLTLVLAGALIVAVAAPAAFARSAATPKLTGTVGPGFTITLTQNGKKVKSLKAGKYVFKITDKASIHNVVAEKGQSKWERGLPEGSATGTKPATITLTKGTWKYYCEPHESS